MAAYRALYLSVSHSIAPSGGRSEQERQAELDLLPKRMQDRIRRLSGAG